MYFDEDLVLDIRLNNQCTKIFLAGQLINLLLLRQLEIISWNKTPVKIGHLILIPNFSKFKSKKEYLIIA